MNRIPLLVLLTLLANAPCSQAQQPASPPASDPEVGTSVSYQESSPATAAVTPTQIIQHKAQTRAQQRMARLEKQQWYGTSAVRPRTSGTPFTSRYGYVQLVPVFRHPFAWSGSRYSPMVALPRP